MFESLHPRPACICQMFDSLKRELEGQHKVRTQLVKEREELRRKADASDVTIVQLLDDKVALKKQVGG